MKNYKILIASMSMLLIVSCATKATFPISTVTPAAVIKAKMTQDKNDNYEITVTADNLASAERLEPTEKVYVVWVVTENNGTKNIGQFKNENAKSSFLKTSTPYIIKEIFITAENSSDISYPSGVEISRASLSPKN